MKSNKCKTAQNISIAKLKIQEPTFEVNNAASKADKKLLAQLERERKEEQEANLMKEKLEAEKKKKKNKASNKTKPKQEDISSKLELFETPKSRRNESDEKNENFQRYAEISERNSFDANSAKFDSINYKKQKDLTQNNLFDTPIKTWDESYESNTSFEDTEKNTSKSNAEISGRKLREGDWNSMDEKKSDYVKKPNYSNRGSYGTDTSWNEKKKSNRGSYGMDTSWNEKKTSNRGSYGMDTSWNEKYVRVHYNFSNGKDDESFQKFVNNKKIFKKKVREIQGDLFTAPEDYSLAHCVAEDFSMGAGIAKEFKAKFKSVAQLLDQKAKTGGLAILEHNNRFIYYLVTKAVSRGKPTIYTLWKSLIKLRDHITEHGVTKLAIPQIGCGLDRLDWDEVKNMLEYIFNEIEIDIAVYILNLNAEESPNPSPSRSLRKCYVVHKVLPLVDIESQTGLIYFGTEDGAVTHEMECLAKKYNFINKYKTEKKSIGDVIKIEDRNEYLYGLIIKQSISSKMNFVDFEKCLFNLRKMLKADKTVYIGLQGFTEKDDGVKTEKLVSLMQYILQDVEIWVCWPQELHQNCPQTKQY